MRLFALTLTILLAVAFAGEPEAPADPGLAPPAEAPADSAGEDSLDLLGGARIAKVVSPEWARIEEFTQRFYAGELDDLYEDFSPTYRKEFSIQDLAGLRTKMIEDFGEEVEVVATRIEEKDGYHAFFRAARFSADDRLIEVAFVIASDDTIAGLFVTPDRTPQSSAP